MKKATTWSEILMILVLTAFSFSASYADDLSIWNGKWFKLTEKISALEANESGSISPLNYSQTIYIHIYEVDETNKVLRCENYDFRDGGLEFYSDIDLQVLAGSSFDFLWWAQGGPEMKGAIAGRIQGKTKNGPLTSATLKTVGGSVAGTMDGAPAVAGINWNGSIVPESKVPPVK